MTSCSWQCLAELRHQLHPGSHQCWPQLITCRTLVIQMDVPSTVMVLQVVGKAALGQSPGSQTQPLRAWTKEKTVEIAEEVQPGVRPGRWGSRHHPHFTAPLLCPLPSAVHLKEETCVLMAMGCMVNSFWAALSVSVTRLLLGTLMPQPSWPALSTNGAHLAARERPMEKQQETPFIVPETVRTGAKGRALVMSTRVWPRAVWCRYVASERRVTGG